MLRKFFVAGFVLVLVVMVSFAATPARAMTPGVVSSSVFTCSSVTITYTTVGFDRDNTGTGYEAYTFTVADGYGVILYSVSNVVLVGGTISAQTELFTFATAPTANPIRVTLVSNAGNTLSQQTLWDFTGECPGLPSVAAPGPAIPDGFVLRTITCDVAVYDRPAGAPVGNNRVQGGQTWYVSASPIKGADGQSWTEIFVAGYTNAFIPTRCVK
jgi:hypothetical protein